MSKVLMLLPHIGKYRFKDEEEKRYMRSIILDDAESLIAKGHRVFCLREDHTALDIFINNKYIEWVSVINEADLVFMESNVEDYPKDKYRMVQLSDCPKQVLEELDKRCKLMSIRQCKGDIQMYNINRLNTIEKKIKIGKELLSDKFKITYRYVVDFKKNPYNANDFGDGKLKVFTDLNNGLKYCEFGGCSISSEQLSSILEVI